MTAIENDLKNGRIVGIAGPVVDVEFPACLLYTSDAADE